MRGYGTSVVAVSPRACLSVCLRMCLFACLLWYRCGRLSSRRLQRRVDVVVAAVGGTRESWKVQKIGRRGESLPSLSKSAFSRAETYGPMKVAFLKMRQDALSHHSKHSTIRRQPCCAGFQGGPPKMNQLSKEGGEAQSTPGYHQTPYILTSTTTPNGRLLGIKIYSKVCLNLCYLLVVILHVVRWWW